MKVCVNSSKTSVLGIGNVRGALGHRIVAMDGKFTNGPAVVPSTWSAGPRDTEGQNGAYEAALEGRQLADVMQPLEILRTIRSFDPCIAWAVRVVLDSTGGRASRFGRAGPAALAVHATEETWTRCGAAVDKAPR